MNELEIEKLNQLISRTDMSGNKKVEWLVDFIEGTKLQQEQTKEMEKKKTIDFACEVMFGRKDIGINLRNFVISKYNETFKQQAQ
jgi:hypothetical protein